MIYLLSLGSINGIISQDNLPIYHYPYKIYTVSDGMSQSLTKCIYQDKKGFIWVGTREGLNRFDGLKFENHITNPNYPDDIIENIVEDGKGNIWVEGFNGIYRYEADTLTYFSHYTPDSVKIINLKKDNEGNIWGSGAGGIFKHEANKFVSYNHLLPDSLQNRYLFIQCFDEKNNFWFRTDSSQSLLYFLTKEKKITSKKLEKLTDKGFWINQIEYLPEKGLAIELHNSQDQWQAVWLDSDMNERLIFPDIAEKYAMKKVGNKLYIKKNNSIYQFENGNATLITTADNPFKSFDIRGEKIVIADRVTRRVLKWYKNRWHDYGINFAPDMRVFLDEEERLWIVANGGLAKVENEAILVFPPERGMLQKTYSILEDDSGDYWMSSYDFGLKKLNKHLQYETVSGYETHLIDGELGFYTGAIKASNGDLLFPTQKNIIVYNESAGFELMPNTESDHAPIQHIKEIDGTYYCATKGLRIIHEDGTSTFYKDTLGLDTNRLHFIESIEKDTNDIWWLTSHHGLVKFDGKTFESYYVHEELNSGMNCVFKDYKENLWFGSHGGLLIYDYINDLPRPVGEQEIKGSIKFISSIDSTYLVLGMLDKMVLLDLHEYYNDSLNYYILDDENGFDGLDCVINSGFVDSKKDIWIATRTNVMKLMPDELKLNNLPTPVLYNSITYKLSETTSSYDEIKLSDTVNHTIPLKSNHSFQINFYTINYSNPKKIRYQYMLEGYESEWSPPSVQRYANYSNIPVGNYTFKVRSLINQNHSNENTLTLKINPGMWYEAKWVLPSGIILFLTIISGLIYQTYSRRKYKRRTQKQLLLQELKELKIRHRLLLNQANPHFTFNILNHIIALVKKGRLLDTRRYIGMFGELFRPMLRDDGKLTWSLKEEMEFVDSYLQLEKLRFPDKFEYSIHIDRKANRNSFIPKMVIQSFVNNAIKHGIEPKKTNDGHISISISQEDDFFDISISDNGLGFNQKKSDSNNAGSGIKTVQHTLQWLNERHPIHSSVTISGSEDNEQKSSGVKVLLKLFTKYENL